MLVQAEWRQFQKILSRTAVRRSEHCWYLRTRTQRKRQRDAVSGEIIWCFIRMQTKARDALFSAASVRAGSKSERKRSFATSNSSDRNSLLCEVVGSASKRVLLLPSSSTLKISILSGDLPKETLKVLQNLFTTGGGVTSSDCDS